MIVQTKHFAKLANIKVWSDIQTGIFKSQHGSFRILSNNFCKQSKPPSPPKPHKTILLPEEPVQTLDNKINNFPLVEVLEDDKKLDKNDQEEVPKKKDSLKQKLTNKLKSIVTPADNAEQETPKPEKKILEIPVEAVTKPRIRVDLSVSSTERNFITPNRAMSDFLLKQNDFEGLRIIKRRSPYENEPPISVYWRKDVEAKAIEVWGSKDRLLQERLKNELERKYQQQHIFTMKRKLREYRREQGSQADQKMAEKAGLSGSSGRVVLTAIAINGANCIAKFIAWKASGSHSMFSEGLHSLADTINQIILAYGIHKSVQRADSDHPYGYTNMKYVASLISGVGIFCVGTGVSCYHGYIGLTNPAPMADFFWSFCVLGMSLVSEGATLIVAFNSIRAGAKAGNISISRYIMQGQDPSVNVVLLEDCAAVLSVLVAGSCMGVSVYTGSHIPDALGSFLVGGILGCVAYFIVTSNIEALVGRSIPDDTLDKINAELESDVMIRAIYDVKGIQMGNQLIRYKAEVDFDGRELTRSYLDQQDLNLMLEEVQSMKTIDELEAFLLKHSENIVDMVGGEIDRIEMKLRKKYPEIRHVDLEVL
uniref:Proton-coupled zinc antiporter SLC30A9, mitochondrial n=1 Tax=Cacopsylla melanoneura TaxID=428564 RepID=A0A8D8ZK36_9HEMI